LAGRAADHAIEAARRHVEGANVLAEEKVWTGHHGEAGGGEAAAEEVTAREKRED